MMIKNTKSVILILFILLISIFQNPLFAATQNDNSLFNDEELVWIKEHPKIIVGGGPDWAPFDFINKNGSYSGIANDYFKLIAKITGLKFEIEIDTWSNNLQKMKENKIDLLGAVYRTKERETFMNYTKPYFEMLDYFFIRDDLDAKKLKDLDTKIVAIPKGYAHGETIKKEFPNIKILTVDTFSEAIDAVLEKKADILFDTYASLSYVIKKESINTIIPFKSYRGHNVMKLHMATSKDNQLLKSIINKAFDVITDDEKKEIHAKWLGKNIRNAPHTLSLNDEEKEWIKNNPTITLGADALWPPFDFADEKGNHTGLSSYLVELIGERTGLNIKVKIDTWPKIVKLVKEKKLDGYTCITKSSERKKYLNFTTPYLKTENGIFVIKDKKGINNIKDLVGKKIAVSRGTYLHELLLSDYSELSLYLVDSDEDAIDALSYNKVDAFVGNIAVANYLMNKKFITHFKVVDKINNNITEISFAIQKDNPILLSIIQKALDSISFEERQKILKKWYIKSTQVAKIILSDKEKHWLKKNNQILFAGDPNSMPFEAFDEKGKHIGIVADYLKNIEQLLSIKFKTIQTKNYSETITHAKKGDVDVISGDIDTASLQKHYKPIEPYIKSPIVIVMRDSNGFVDDIKNISKKKIALIEKNTHNTKIKKAYPNQEFFYEKNANLALKSLSLGKIDAVLLTIPKAEYLIRTQGYTTLKIVGKTTVNLSLTLFVKKSKPELYSMLSKAMKVLSNTKHLDILSRWQKVEFAQKIDYTLLYQLVGFFCILILGTLYWNKKLSNEIEERKRIEKDLNIEKENFKALFEKVSDGNLIIKNGKYITCNDAVLKMLGLNNIKEFLGSTQDRWSPTFQYDGLRSDLKAKKMMEICFKDGSNRFEWIHKDINNNEFWVDVGLTKILYEGVDAIYVVWRDISQQKNLESSLKNSELQMRTLIDNIPLHIIVSSYDGKVLLANPKTINDYDFNTKDISKINVAEFYADPTTRDEIINDIKTKGKVEQKIVKLKRPNAIHSMMMSILPIRYAEKDALLSIGVDLTERLNMEKALIEAKNKADSANRSKSEFLANMSHEIRTPMNAIIGFTELLNDQISEPRLKSYVKIIQNASYTLLALINDILDLSKIEAGKLEIKKTSTNIFSLCDEISSFFMISVRDKNLDFIVDIDKNIPKSLLIDEIRLRQVLLNIIGNSVKFTEEGFIKFSVKAFNIDNHNSKVDLEFSIKDSGIGIPDNQIGHIFNEFEQTQGQDNKKFGGTGLGLSISKRLCEMMGGKISVCNNKDKGVTFFVNLYKIDISSIMDEKQLDKKLNLNAKEFIFKKAKILVVDDIKDNRELILKNFEDTNIKIITANDGFEAIEQYKKQKPDLILMDIRMPNMDGYEAAKKIKKIANVPIVALTASVMEDDNERLKSKNFDAYLRKPVMRYDLFNELSKFLTYNKTKQSLNDEEDTFALSQKAKKNIDLILKKIDDDIKPILLKSLKTNNIANIKALASKIDNLALEFEIELFDKYAKNLYEAIDSFDILKIQKLLSEFDNIEKKIIS